MYASSSPSSGELQIGIALVLQDRFSNQAREASSAIRELHSQAKQATDANLSAVRSLASMGAAAGMFAMGAMASTVKEGAEFIDVMTMVDTSAKKVGISMEQLSNKAMEVGKATMFTSRDVADAMRLMAMAGVNTQEIYNSIGSVANLAGATMTQMGGENGAGSLLTNVMRQFKVDVTEKNMSHVADILAMGATRANMSLNDLAESIKYGGSTLKNLGGTLEQSVAMFGVLGNAGIRGSMAGTAVANMYRYFARSVSGDNKKGQKSLLALGFTSKDFMDVNGNLMDMGTAMARIGAQSQKMGNIQFFNDLVNILGVRGERAGSALSSSFATYQNILSQVNNSQGFAESSMEKRMGNLAGSIDKVTSSLETIRISFAKSIAPILIPVLNRLMDIENVVTAIFQVPILGTFLAGLATAVVVVGTLRLGFFALKASALLMFNSSTVSLKNMFSVMSAGYRAATMSAEQYAATEAAIIAQRKAGFGATAGRTAAEAAASSSFSSSAANALRNNEGVWQNGYMYKNNRFWQKTPGKGIGYTRVTGASAVEGMASAMKGGGTGMPPFGATVVDVGGAVSGGTFKGMKAMFSGGTFVGFFRNIANLVKGGAILRGIFGGLKIISAILGGPTGIAITLIATFLPSIINGITDLVSSNKDNASATDANTNVQIRKQNMDARANVLSKDEQNVLLITAINNLNKTLASGHKGDIVVNVDGKEAFKKAWDGYHNNDKKSSGR